MTSATRRGIISGYVLKLGRESTGHSQERLALVLGVDRGTVQGWESGLRPLTAAGYGRVMSLRQRLLALGARPDLIAALAPAVDADLLLEAILDLPADSVDLGQHPVGWTVQSRAVVEMLMWAAVGTPPRLMASTPAPRRRGPVADGPALTAAERATLWDHLRILAERARGREGALLLHRQASFLGSCDPAGTATAWLRPTPQAKQFFGRSSTWSPYWADARSLAVALARDGDTEPLQDFIAAGVGDTAWEQANLTYWAYWVGEVREQQPSDDFMVDPAVAWSGAALYAHLVACLGRASTWLDLNVHSLWSLLQVRQGLSAGDRASTAILFDQSESLLDSGRLSPRARHELGSVRYALIAQGLQPAKEQP